MPTALEVIRLKPYSAYVHMSVYDNKKVAVVAGR